MNTVKTVTLAALIGLMALAPKAYAVDVDLVMTQLEQALQAQLDNAFFAAQAEISLEISEQLEQLGFVDSAQAQTEEQAEEQQ
ncbi:hypothetical protein [Paraferrimonas sp. SM1919]|uniref:hypothetical protein n=1 Tax=Paraferrimonas sp. SM1919 TaxID=2662263 RepID=UPI0013D5696A|nr:hypothetical protein [Paraferrimonas sp. SM1919]